MKIRVQESEAEIAREILNCLKSELDKALRDTALALRPIARAILGNRIAVDETWQSLHGGKLQAEFGLDSTALSGLQDILDTWLKNINVDYKPITITGSTLKGGFILDMIKEDWSDVLSSSAAVVVTKTGQVLPWLEWLLINGSKIIVRDFELVMKSSSRSRSGMALMVKKSSGRWRVPPEYAGTTNNNFMTKILEDIEDLLIQEMENEITKRL